MAQLESQTFVSIPILWVWRQTRCCECPQLMASEMGVENQRNVFLFQLDGRLGFWNQLHKTMIASYYSCAHANWIFVVLSVDILDENDDDCANSIISFTPPREDDPDDFKK
jgi:hypothetical protein